MPASLNAARDASHPVSLPLQLWSAAKHRRMRLQLCTDGLPERDRFPYWHEAVCQPMFHVTLARLADAAGFRAKLDIQIAGRFTLTDLETSHGSIEKTAGDIARGASDSVPVYLAVESSQHYQLGPHDYPMAPGDVCIVPMDRRFHCQAGDMAFRSLLIPHAVLSPLMAVRELTRAHHLPASAPLGALLGASLNAAASQLPLLSDELGDAVLSNFSGLVALALSTSDEGREAGRTALRAARLDAVKRHVGKHLSDPTLDPASAAAALGMSARQMHLLFHPTGDTFTQYVLRRRLEACRTTLSSPLGMNRSVADVAFGWGFNSLSVFYRAFAAAFAISPGSLRAATILHAHRSGR